MPYSHVSIHQFHVNPSSAYRPTFIHNVFSSTESQHSCSHADGEHPTHFSRIKISTAHLTTTLYVHLFLWDDEKWLLRVFWKTKSSVALPFSSPRCNMQPNGPQSWQPESAASVRFMWIIVVTNVNVLKWHSLLQEYSHNLMVLQCNLILHCCYVWQHDKQVSQCFTKRNASSSHDFPKGSSGLTFIFIE